MIIDLFQSEVRKGVVPLLNYMEQYSGLPVFQDYKQISRKKHLMNMLLYKCPEALGIIRAIRDDICGKFHFEPLDETTSGRNKVKKADEFCRNNGFKRNLKPTVFDILSTGDGFNWVGKLSPEQMAVLKSAFASMNDEDIVAPRKLRSVASTSMTVNHDRYKVWGYTQYIGTEQGTYTPEEIIHLTLENIDGKVEGFTPLISLILQMELAFLMWQNQFMLQKKGNHPDYLISSEKINMNHPSYKKLESTLKQYNNPNSVNHGTLLLTGDKFTAQQLEKVDNLQFKEVDQYVMNIIALQWKYPQSKLGIKTKESASGNDSNNTDDRDYWKGIASHQDIIAEIYNVQFFEPEFGVKMVFDKSYLHDEVVEGTAENMRLTNLDKKLAILQNAGKTLSDDALLLVVNNQKSHIDSDDLEDYEPPVIEANYTAQALTSHGAPPKGGSPPAKNKDEGLSKQKANVQAKIQENTGKPTGV